MLLRAEHASTSSSSENSRVPRVLVPYAGPDASSASNDIFVYLRPEANGVLAESAIFKVIERCSAYKKELFLVYLANFPGDFIARHRLVEHHYAVKLAFAVRGAEAFTPHMREAFERHFGVDFDEDRPIGAFEALRALRMKAEALFSAWVPEDQILTVNGQTVKRIADRYVVNYDIPALLHKNTANTDIAVMLFRTRTSYEYFLDLVKQMREAVVDEGIIRKSQHFTRAFHYSKSPFEQALDSRSYLCAPGGKFLGLSCSSFANYCFAHGIDEATLHGLLENPICRFAAGEGDGGGDRDGDTDGGGGNRSVEEHLFSYTQHDSYEAAIEKARRITSQLWIVQ